MPRLKEQEGGRVKPSNYKQDYTRQQILEIKRCTDDVIYFVEKYVFIQHPTLGRMPFKLFDYQKRLLLCYIQNRHCVSMLSRQTGKTTTAAAFILWWAIFKDDQKIVVASKDAAAAKDIINRLWFAYEELPWWLKPGVKENSVFTKVFDNGTTITGGGTTKTTGRGQSNSLVYCDELAYVRQSIVSDFWSGVMPTLSVGGKMIVTSTPNTDEDKFANIWFNAKMSPLSDKWVDQVAMRAVQSSELEEEEKYETIFETEEVKDRYDGANFNSTDEDELVQGFTGFHAHWRSVPDYVNGGFRGEKYKRQILASGFTERQWLTEYECSFISGDATLISAHKLSTLRSYMRNPKFIDKWGCRWYREIKPNMAYAVVLDPSDGVELDDACIQVWEIPHLKQVAEWNSNVCGQSEQAKMLRRVLKRIYQTQQNDSDHHGGVDIYYSVERNGLGVGILTAIDYEDERTFPGWLIDASATSINVRGNRVGIETQNRWRGLITTVSTKKRYCLEFKSLVERNLFSPVSEYLISQMKTFVKKNGSYAAKDGTKDDIIMSCILMCHLVDELRSQVPELDDYVRPEVLDEYSPDDSMHPDNMPMLPIV
jgi:hypothetical protein